MSGTFMNFQCLGSKERSIQAGDLDQEVSKIAHRTEKCVHFVYSRGAQRTNLHFLTFSLPKRYPLIVALLRHLRSSVVFQVAFISPLSNRECVNVA